MVRYGGRDPDVGYVTCGFPPGSVLGCLVTTSMYKTYSNA
jgi:hypothetical protein